MDKEVALLAAIENDDLENVKTLLPSANIATYQFKTPVCACDPIFHDHPPLVSAAAFYGATSILLEMIDMKVNLTQLDGKRRDVAYFAVAGGHTTAVKFLARHGVNFGECCHLAAGMWKPEIVKFLLGELKLDPSVIDAFGYTLLHSAAIGGCADVVTFLLALGVFDVNAIDNDGNTALHLAAQHGNVSIVRVLAEHPDIDLNPVNVKSQSILHFAAEKPNDALLNLILETAGLGPQQRPNWDVFSSFIL